MRGLARGEAFSSGVLGIVWDGTDHSGRGVPADVYMYRLKAGGDTDYGRMMLVK